MRYPTQGILSDITDIDKNPPDQAIDAALHLIHLGEAVNVPEEFSLASIEGFDRHLLAMREALILATKSRTEDTARAFLRAVHESRQYALYHFAPHHGVLILTYKAMEAVSDMAGLDVQAEERRLIEQAAA